LDMMGVKDFLIVQNKIDLVSQEVALTNYSEIKEFLESTCPRALKSPVIPTCANRGLNVEFIYSYLGDLAPPHRDITSPPLMIIVRSFDVNKPGEMDIDKLQGGVAGGSLVRGELVIGDEIEIRPGKIIRAKNGTYTCRPLRSKVNSLFSEKNDLKKACPGGLIGVGTNIDPSFAKGDGLVGQVLGLVGHLPPVYSEIDMSYLLIQRDEENNNDKENKNISLRVQKNEELRLNIGSITVDAQVKAVKADMARLTLKFPACILDRSKVSISRRMGKIWRLVGVGQVQSGKAILA